MLTLAHSAFHVLGWHLDPVVVGGLAVSVWLFGRGRRLRRLPPRQSAAFAVGWAVVAIAALSPLDSLSERLVSAHMVQHLLVTLVAAPLLVAAEPVRTMTAGLPRNARRKLPSLRPLHGRAVPWVSVWLFSTGSLWMWHAAWFYEAALGNELVHGLQHLTFLAAGLAFWGSVGMAVKRRRHGDAILFIFTSGLAGVFLSAIMTFSSSAWYEPYVSGGPDWALSPDEDQRLAGLLMWFWSSFTYAGAIVWLVAGWIRSTAQSTSGDSVERGSRHAGGRELV